MTSSVPVATRTRARRRDRTLSSTEETSAASAKSLMGPSSGLSQPGARTVTSPPVPSEPFRWNGLKVLSEGPKFTVSAGAIAHRAFHDPAARGNGSMNLKQKVLMSVGTLGVAAAVAAGGSFATFNAQTSNPGTFATGTLVMSNTVNTGTACLSTGGGSINTNVNNACDALFNLTVKQPGDSATANLTIKNEGSVDAAALKSFATGCTNANAGAENYHGTGMPCSAVQLYIQQTDSAFTAKTACLYGGAAVANTCDFSDTSKTVGDFATNYTNSGNGVSLGSGLTAGTSDYFVIGVKLPSSADNTYQGRQATFGLSWFMQ